MPSGPSNSHPRRPYFYGQGKRAQHNHLEVDIIDLDKYTQAEVDALLAAQDELSELDDVTISGPASLDFLQWNGSAWVDRSYTEAGLYSITVADATFLKLDCSNDPLTAQLEVPSILSDFIQFDTTYSDGSAEGRLQWNAEDGTLEVGMPGGNVNLQIGQEQLVRCRNESGVAITNGSVVYIIGASGNKPLLALADASVVGTSDVIGFATEDIAHNANGYVTLTGLVRDVDTAGYTEGDALYLSETAGEYTATKPTQPAIAVHLGHVLAVHASTGVLFASVVDGEKYTRGEIDASISDFFNGTFVEHFRTVVSESAGTVTVSLDQSSGGDLTMRFHDGEVILDCTPAQTMALTVGASDAAPQGNWLYILESTGALTKSTTGWPVGVEHIKVAFFLCQTAASVAAIGGTYVHQNWNDHRAGTDDMGHMAHMAERVRITGAQYFSGVDGAGVDNYLTVGAGTSDFKSEAGVIFQMHRHVFPAVDMSTGDHAHVVNWNGEAYHLVNDLFEIIDDSEGNTLSNNKYFNLVFWGVANQTGTHETLMVNLPSGQYTSQASAENDTQGYDNFTIPREFSLDSSTGFLICRVTIQMGATWTVVSTTDLRGTTPQTASGGGVGGVVTNFNDELFTVFDDADSSKVMEFELSGVSTATVRTLTVPDASGTIALVGGITPVSGAYTVLVTDDTVLGDASGGAFTVTLPTAAAGAGLKFTIKKTDSSANAVTIDGDAAETIDGVATVALSAQYEAFTVQSDGANWWIL